jgi:pentatricopeptide repeat protein
VRQTSASGRVSGRVAAGAHQRWSFQCTPRDASSSPFSLAAKHAVVRGVVYRWEEALEVFERMKAARVPPTTVTFNTLISACEKGWQWEQAMKVFEQMKKLGVASDTITFASLILACEKGGKAVSPRSALRARTAAAAAGEPRVWPSPSIAVRASDGDAADVLKH